MECFSTKTDVFYNYCCKAVYPDVCGSLEYASEIMLLKNSKLETKLNTDKYFQVPKVLLKTFDSDNNSNPRMQSKEKYLSILLSLSSLSFIKQEAVSLSSLSAIWLPQRPTLGHKREDNLTQPMLIIAFLSVFDKKSIESLEVFS